MASIHTFHAAAPVEAAKPRTKTSPEPELHGTPARRFRHEPYGPLTSWGKLYCYDDAPAAAADADTAAALPPPMTVEEALAALPPGTLHRGLAGLVGFVAYPTESFAVPADAVVPPACGPRGRGLVRCFFGQLPYAVTDMQLAWLCYTFGGGCVVVDAERITKRQPGHGGKVMPTGCLHAYATAAAVATLNARMHKALLIDDSGVWFARDAAERAALRAYCDELKRDRTRRFANRPYDAVSVERATSTYRGPSTPPPSPPPEYFRPNVGAAAAAAIPMPRLEADVGLRREAAPWTPAGAFYGA